jgi:3-phosphoshikimate 1-carboxyvinyltransferase
MEKIIESGSYAGQVQIPPSKSDAQRALIAAALAKGTSTLNNLGISEDVHHVLEAVQRLTAQTEVDAQTLKVSGMNCWPDATQLNCGESGLATRLLTSICAASGAICEIDGKGTLLERPMHFFEQHFPKMGAHFTSNANHLPFRLKGPLKAGTYEVDGSQSSQYISGLLMALPMINGDSELRVKGVTSLPYIRMTLDTLEAFGIQISFDMDYTHFIIKGNQAYQATNYSVEGDWSSASYWLVASALGADIQVKGLNMQSAQADKQLLNALITAGCSVIKTDTFIQIMGQKRQPLNFDANHCPDLFPALVTFAAFTPGKSTIHGVKRLYTKESNRALTLQSEFSKLGVQIELADDTMYIHGKKSVSGGAVFSHNDHRIAMCLAIAGIFTSSNVMIENAEAVSKSYPNFWEDFASLTKK